MPFPRREADARRIIWRNGLWTRRELIKLMFVTSRRLGARSHRLTTSPSLCSRQEIINRCYNWLLNRITKYCEPLGEQYWVVIGFVVFSAPTARDTRLRNRFGETVEKSAFGRKKTIKWCISSDVSPTGVTSSGLSEGEGRLVQNGGFCCCQASSSCPSNAVQKKTSYYVSTLMHSVVTFLCD